MNYMQNHLTFKGCRFPQSHCTFSQISPLFHVLIYLRVLVRPPIEKALKPKYERT